MYVHLQPNTFPRLSVILCSYLLLQSPLATLSGPNCFICSDLCAISTHSACSCSQAFTHILCSPLHIHVALSFISCKSAKVLHSTKRPSLATLSKKKKPLYCFVLFPRLLPLKLNFFLNSPLLKEYKVPREQRFLLFHHHYIECHSTLQELKISVVDTLILKVLWSKWGKVINKVVCQGESNQP